MSVDEGLYVQQKFRMGQRRYTNLSNHYLESVGVKHPSTRKLTERQNEICPTLTEVEEGGVWAHVPDLVQRSLQSTITHLVEPEKLDEVPLDENLTGMCNDMPSVISLNIFRD